MVYGDIYIFLNFAADYLLLFCTARLCGAAVRRWRLVLFSVLGGCYALASLLLSVTTAAGTVLDILAGVLLSAGTFGLRRRTVRCTAVFFLLAGCFAGVVTGTLRLVLRTGRPGTAGLLLILGLTSGALLRLLSGNGSAARRETHPVTVTLQGRQTSFCALVDTGNLLCDPMSGKYVLVTEQSALYPLFPPALRHRLSGEKDVQKRFEILHTSFPKARCRLIPYGTASGGGLLMAFQPDGLTVEQRSRDDVLVAVTERKLSRTGAYTALMGPWD